MNEKLQYAEMLDIPVNTCKISYKPPKRRFGRKTKVNPEEIKKKLVDKVNKEVDIPDSPLNAEAEDGCTEALQEIKDGENVVSDDYEDSASEVFESSVNIRKIGKSEKKFRFSVIAVQFAVIGVLLSTIFLTNALIPTSGINTLINSVFGQKTVVEDEDRRMYSEFTPILPSDAENIVLDCGIMSFSAEDSIYAPCDGVVTDLTTGEDGRFTVEITHSENFKSVFSGLDYAYCEKGDSVFSNIPVGYTFGQQAKLCFIGGEGSVITDYSISENSVVWAV